MLAIIPARGGSKGLPKKNIRDLGGKPLIAHTIEAALCAESVSRVLVTTDDEEIARTARYFSAEVPFLRPKELATDTASAIDVYLHAIDFIQEHELTSLEKFMVLLPTAPFRTSEDIDAAAALFKSTGATSLVSMTEAEIPPSWYFIKKADGTISNAGFGTGKRCMYNRQKNPTFYIPNGAIYILDVEYLRQRRSYYADDTVPYVMPLRKSIDIDTPFDFELAALLLSTQAQ